jgi:hypothetical protein
MSEKWHNTLRFLQWFVPALATFYGVLDKAFGWGYSGIVMTIVAGFVTFIGVCVEHDSADYFSTKSIVTKLVPDTEAEKEAE